MLLTLCSGWRPHDLATLRAWFAADSPTATPITTWNDLSGNGHNTTGVSVSEPTRGATLNGLNTIEFTAASSQFYHLPFAMLASLTEGSVYFVVKNKTTGASPPPVAQFGSNTAGDQYPSADANIYTTFLSTSLHSFAKPSGLDAWHIGEFFSKASDFRYAKDGVDVFTTGTNTVGLPAEADAGPYIATNGGGFLDGFIAEIVFCSNFLTTADRERVEGYLAHKWGLTANLPAGHTYKTNPPIVSSSFSVTIQAQSTPAPSLSRSSGKPLQTTSTPAPALVRQAGKPLQTTSTPVPTLTTAKTTPKVLDTASTPAPSLTRQTNKPLQTTSTPAPSLVRSITKSLQAGSTPVPTLAKASPRSFQAITTPAPSLVRQAGKPLQTSTTPVPTLTRTQGYTRSFQAQSTPVPTLVRAVGKPLQAQATPVPTLLRLTSKALQVTTTPVPALSRARGYVRSFQVESTPVPTLVKQRVFVVNIQAITGGVASGGVGGVRVTAAFFRA